jgi:hypothetical protein
MLQGLAEKFTRMEMRDGGKMKLLLLLVFTLLSSLSVVWAVSDELEQNCLGDLELRSCAFGDVEIGNVFIGDLLIDFADDLILFAGLLGLAVFIQFDSKKKGGVV